MQVISFYFFTLQRITNTEHKLICLGVTYEMLITQCVLNTICFTLTE